MQKVERVRDGLDQAVTEAASMKMQNGMNYLKMIKRNCPSCFFGGTLIFIDFILYRHQNPMKRRFIGRRLCIICLTLVLTC